MWNIIYQKFIKFKDTIFLFKSTNWIFSHGEKRKLKKDEDNLIENWKNFKKKSNKNNKKLCEEYNKENKDSTDEVKKNKISIYNKYLKKILKIITFIFNKYYNLFYY